MPAAQTTAQTSSSTPLSPWQDLENILKVIRKHKLASMYIMRPDLLLTLDVDYGVRANLSKLAGLNPRAQYITWSKNGGKHFYISLRKEDYWTNVPDSLYWKLTQNSTSHACRAMFAAHAGSDPIREAMSAVRHINNYPYAYKLFEPRENLPGLIRWLKRRKLWEVAIREVPETEIEDKIRYQAQSPSFV